MTDRTITPENVAAIAKLPTVISVAPNQEMESLTISAGRYTATTLLFGVTPTYHDVYIQAAGAGRLISETDVSFGRSVIVLGLAQRRKLFPGQNPIGKTVRVGTHLLEVVGIQSSSERRRRFGCSRSQSAGSRCSSAGSGS